MSHQNLLLWQVIVSTDRDGACDDVYDVDGALLSLMDFYTYKYQVN